MTIQAQTPDGVTHEFPDGTSDDVVDGAIKSYLNPTPSLRNEGDVLGKFATGQITAPSAALQTMGNEAQAGWDATGSMIKSIPGYGYAKKGVNAAWQGFQKGAQGISNMIDSPEAEQEAVRTGNAVSGISNGVSQLAKNHPELAGDAEAVGKILPVESTLGLAGDVAKSGLKAAAENAAGYEVKIPSPIRAYPEIEKANNALGDNTSAAYQKAHNLGLSVPAPVAQAMASQVRSDVGTLVPKASPQTSSLLKAFDKAADSDDGLTLPTIEEYRKQLGRIAWNASNPNDYGKAQAAKNAIDKYLDHIANNPGVLSGGTPEAVDALNEARSAHSLESQHDTLAEIGRQANGDPNIIQSKLKTLFNNKDDFYSFSPEDRQIISTIAHPTGMTNALEKIGKIGFGAGSRSLPAWGDAGTAAVAMAMGNPVTAAALTTPVIAGTAANAARGTIIKRAFDNLLKGIENKSVPAGSSDIFKGLQQQQDLAGEMQPMRYGPTTPNQDKYIKAIQPPNSDQKLLPAPPVRVDSAGIPAQPLAKSYTDTRPGVIQEGRGTPPPIAPNAPVTSQISPRQQRAIQAGQILNKPEDVAKQTLVDMAAGKPSSPAPIKSFQDIGPGIPEAMARQHAFEQAEEERQLMNMQGPHGYKKGGAVPSQAQIEAGNYKKGHTKFQGLDISIETPKGAIRSGKDKGGKEWSVCMPTDYGYLKRTVAADGEHVDCYIGPNKKSNRVYVIDQHHLHNKSYDECKVMLGFATRDEAISTYKAGFSDGKGAKRIGRVTRMSVDEFKDWLKNGDTKKPMKEAA